MKTTKVRGARKSIQSSSKEETFLSAFSQFNNSLLPSNSFRIRSGISPKNAIFVKLLEGIQRGDMRAVSPLLLRGMSLHMIRYRCLDLSYSHVDDSGIQAISYLSSCLQSLSLRATKVCNHAAISQLLIFTSQVTDAGLAVLSSFGSLKRLDIGKTGVSGAVFRQWHKKNQTLKRSGDKITTPPAMPLRQSVSAPQRDKKVGVPI